MNRTRCVRNKCPWKVFVNPHCRRLFCFLYLSHLSRRIIRNILQHVPMMLATKSKPLLTKIAAKMTRGHDNVCPYVCVHHLCMYVPASMIMPAHRYVFIIYVCKYVWSVCKNYVCAFKCEWIHPQTWAHVSTHIVPKVIYHIQTHTHVYITRMNTMHIHVMASRCPLQCIFTRAP